MEAARALIGERSVSGVIDVALGRLIRTEQLRRDVEAYSRQPPTADEIVLADLDLALDLDDDEVDYDADYGASVTPPPAPRRGEVWFADVPGDRDRPVLVLSRDPMGRLLHSVICAPITTTVRDLATEVELDEAAGLARRSVANFDNTLLLSRQRLLRRVGRASNETMHGACRALAIATGCDGP